MTLSITILVIIICHFAECRVFLIVMLNVIMLSLVFFIMLSVVMLSVIMLSVVMLNVVMLSAVAPFLMFVAFKRHITHNDQSYYDFYTQGVAVS
jgi:hypothetical protein